MYIFIIENFKYLTVINLIYKEAPFFNSLILPTDKITWTLDKYHLDLFPWQALVDEVKITNMWYNAGSTLKFNLFHKLGKSLDQVANGLKPEITKTELKRLYNYCKKDRLYKYCKRG